MQALTRVPGSERLFRYVELVHVLTARFLKVRYRGSVLGVYWSLLNPIVMTAIYTAVFGTSYASYYNNSIVDYCLAVFVGLVVVNFFAQSTSQALTSVVSNSALLNKIKLPTSVFPLSQISAACFQLTIGAFPFLVVITMVTSKSLLNVVLLPIPLIALILVCGGIGLFVSMLYVFFRDIPYFYEIVSFVMWITSPVFYPLQIVPPNIRAILVWNPLSSIIEGLRELTLSGAPPNVLVLGQSLLLGLLVFAIGMFAFNHWKHQFMDLL